jgi:hypothetical protein
MGVEQQVHSAVFAAIQGGQKLAMAAFLTGEGIAPARFLSTYNSFAVAGKVEAAKQKVPAYQVSGVPRWWSMVIPLRPGQRRWARRVVKRGRAIDRQGAGCTLTQGTLLLFCGTRLKVTPHN